MPSIRGAVRKKMLTESPQILQQLNQKLLDAVVNKRKVKLQDLRGQKRMQSRTFFPSRNALIQKKNEGAVDRLISQLAEVLNEKLTGQEQVEQLKSLFIQSRQAMSKIQAGLKYAPAKRKKVFDKITRLKSDIDDIYRKQSIHKDRYVDPKDTEEYIRQLSKQYDIKGQLKQVLRSIAEVLDVNIQDVEEDPNFEEIVFSQSRKDRYPKSFVTDEKFIGECLDGTADVQGHFKGHWNGDRGLRQQARLSRAKEVLATNKVDRSEKQIQGLRGQAIKLMEGY